MPLLMLVGHPSCGKTVITHRLLDYLKEKHPQIETIVINYETLKMDKNSMYKDVRSEKQCRSVFKSSVERYLSNSLKKLVIIDYNNNIKGFRYELWCRAKELNTTLATLYVDTTVPLCRQFNQLRKKNKNSLIEDKSIPPQLFGKLNDLKVNDDDDESVAANSKPTNNASKTSTEVVPLGAEAYEEHILEDLLQRLEVPDEKKRWDQPLFTVKITEQLFQTQEQKQTEEVKTTEPLVTDEIRLPQLPFEEIMAALLEGKAPTPSTAVLPTKAEDTNFLFELDRVTQEVLNCVMTAQSNGSAMEGDYITIPHTKKEKILLCRKVTLAELRRMQQSYIKFAKLRTSDTTEGIARSFVQHLNQQLTH